MTGDTAPDRLREAMAGGVRLLHKPISAEALLEAVLQLAPARPD
jgi:CheY-like chemotaxis protein